MFECSVGELSTELVDESTTPANETNQPLAAPFWPGHTAIFRPGSPGRLKGSYSGNPATGCTQMNGPPPFAPDRGLLLWRDP